MRLGARTTTSRSDERSRRAPEEGSTRLLGLQPTILTSWGPGRGLYWTRKARETRTVADLVARPRRAIPRAGAHTHRLVSRRQMDLRVRTGPLHLPGLGEHRQDRAPRHLSDAVAGVSAVHGRGRSERVRLSDDRVELRRVGGRALRSRSARAGATLRLVTTTVKSMIQAQFYWKLGWRWLPEDARGPVWARKPTARPRSVHRSAGRLTPLRASRW